MAVNEELLKWEFDMIDQLPKSLRDILNKWDIPVTEVYPLWREFDRSESRTISFLFREYPFILNSDLSRL